MSQRGILGRVCSDFRQCGATKRGQQSTIAERLLTPIGAQRDFAEDAHLFLERFMVNAADEKEMGGSPGANLAHRYWQRILRARESDIENSSLVLEVSRLGPDELMIDYVSPRRMGGLAGRGHCARAGGVL